MAYGNTADPDQIAVWPDYTLFAIPPSTANSRYLKTQGTRTFGF